MTKRLIPFLTAIALTSGIPPASAALSPSVVVNGLEWLQPSDFISTSWALVGSVCDSNTGVCSGSLTGLNGSFDVTGWTWASVDDVDALFSAYLPSPLGPGPDSIVLDMLDPANEQAVASFFGDFLTTSHFCSTATFSCYDFVDGVTRTAAGPSGYVGSWSLVSPGIFPGPASSSVSTASINSAGPNRGAWLYRSEVPAPATLGLLMAGLAALAFSRRRFHHAE